LSKVKSGLGQGVRRSRLPTVLESLGLGVLE